MPKAFLNGINLYYEDIGKGFPLILTHGFAGTTKSWAGQVAAFTRKYRFITYDMRGHGQSDAPDDPAKYQVEVLVEDIYQLLRHLGIKKAVIGGLSLGGFLTIRFYARHPEMAAGLVIIDTGPGYRTPEKAKDWDESCHDCAEILRKDGIPAFQKSEYSALDYYTAPEVMAKQNPIGLAYVRDVTMKTPTGLDILPTIKVPSLIICGDRDVQFLPATEYMAQKIPGAKKVIIANAGHGVNIDQPEVFNRTVLEFLDSLKVTA